DVLRRKSGNLRQLRILLRYRVRHYKQAAAVLRNRAGNMLLQCALDARANGSGTIRWIVELPDEFRLDVRQLASAIHPGELVGAARGKDVFHAEVSRGIAGQGFEGDEFEQVGCKAVQRTVRRPRGVVRRALQQ